MIVPLSFFPTGRTAFAELRSGQLMRVMAQQQRKKRVLLVKEPRSRSAGDMLEEDPYSLALAEAGYSASFLPVLAHRLHNIPELRAIIQQGAVGRYSGLVFTSQRAVEAWNEAWTAVPASEELRWRDVPFYVVGPATAASLRSLPSHTVPPAELILGAQESGNANALADFIASRHANGTSSNGDERMRPLLYLIGDKTKDTLSTLLHQASIPLKELQVYETYPSPTAQRDIERVFSSDDRFDWVVFFSPSGVKLCSSHFMNGHKPFKIAAIGPTTRDYLQSCSRSVPISAMAESPKPEALVQALQAADLAEP